MRTQNITVPIVIAFLALLACAPSPPPAPTGPTSSLTQERAYNLAQVVALHANATVIRSKGRSMIPSFGPDAIHVVESIGDNPIYPGDVIIFSAESNIRTQVQQSATQIPQHRTVIHRVVQVDGDTYLTRGDANVTTDGWVNRDDVIGRVIATFHTAP